MRMTVEMGEISLVADTDGVSIAKHHRDGSITSVVLSLDHWDKVIDVAHTLRWAGQWAGEEAARAVAAEHEPIPAAVQGASGQVYTPL